MKLLLHVGGNGSTHTHTLVVCCPLYSPHSHRHVSHAAWVTASCFPEKKTKETWVLQWLQGLMARRRLKSRIN